MARYGFQHYEDQGAPPVAELDKTTQLAVLLAHEKAEGNDSFYFPYIAALPEHPPCAWAMSDEELDSALSSLRTISIEAGSRLSETDLNEWRAEAIHTRESLLCHANGLHERYERYFRSEVRRPLTAANKFSWAPHPFVLHATDTGPA